MCACMCPSCHGWVVWQPRNRLALQCICVPLHCPHAAGAVACLQQAVSLYTDMGRLGMAARQLRVRRLLWPWLAAAAVLVLASALLWLCMAEEA